MNHQVTDDELADYIEEQRRKWSQFAVSSGKGREIKRLEFSIGLTTPLYRVMAGDRMVYVGVLKETAVREYNALP